MDAQTREAYNARASQFAAEYEALNPEALRQCVIKYFRPGGRCLDVGCGSGRDAAWLASLGFEVLGLDPSENLLKEARVLHPGLELRCDQLPELETLRAESFDNILCSGVLMHLPSEKIPSACARLLGALRDDGTLVLSFRASRNPGSSREADGRLFTPLEPVQLRELIESLGAKLRHREENHDARQVPWQTWVIQKELGPRPFT